MIDRGMDFREHRMYRIDGYWVDAEGMTWVDSGLKTPSGQRIYTDGESLVVQAGVHRNPNQITD